MTVILSQQFGQMKANTNQPNTIQKNFGHSILANLKFLHLVSNLKADFKENKKH